LLGRINRMKFRRSSTQKQEKELPSKKESFMYTIREEANENENIIPSE
jgi:hypothetical protein